MLHTNIFHQRNSFIIPSTFSFHNCKEKEKQNPLVMKPVEMLGICWGPATSARTIKNTISEMI